MSEQDRPRTVRDLMGPIPTDELLRRARSVNQRMCSGDRRWVMTVPVQDDDSDVVVGEVCRRLEAFERLRERIHTEKGHMFCACGVCREIILMLDALAPGEPKDAEPKPDIPGGPA